MTCELWAPPAVPRMLGGRRSARTIHSCHPCWLLWLPRVFVDRVGWPFASHRRHEGAGNPTAPLDSESPACLPPAHSIPPPPSPAVPTSLPSRYKRRLDGVECPGITGHLPRVTPSHLGPPPRGHGTKQEDAAGALVSESWAETKASLQGGSSLFSHKRRIRSVSGRAPRHPEGILRGFCPSA